MPIPFRMWRSEYVEVKPRIRLFLGKWTSPSTQYHVGTLANLNRRIAAAQWCREQNRKEGRDGMPAEPRTCMTCRHSEPDSDYNFCIKCEKNDETEYSNWEAYE